MSAIITYRYVMALLIASGAEAVYYTDGLVIWRKAVRDGGFALDKAITETGFDGDEDVDWVNVKFVE